MQNARFAAKGEGDLASSWMHAKVYFTKLCSGESALFEWLGPYEMLCLDED